MDFGVGFISTNVMLPILDFFYRIVPSYGFAIIALTLVVRFAVFPLSAGQIRNMRKMRIVQPLMKERQEEIQKRYKNDPTKQQEEMSKLMQEFGNPLAGCLPLVLQMPILFALFATLRGSPFADINYPVDLKIVSKDQIETVQSQNYLSKPQNIYVTDGIHYPIVAQLPKGNNLKVGEKTKLEFQTTESKTLGQLAKEHPESDLKTTLKATKGAERVKINDDGTIEAISPGDVTVQGTIPGLATNTRFLFIKALGQVGVKSAEGKINWDILAMIVFFGLSLYVNQELSGSSAPKNSDGAPDQQQMINKLTPIIFSGMFLFFPLPAGVLMYITVANVFQTLQTFFLMREPLPENLQKLIEEQGQSDNNKADIPFEKRSLKKKEKTN